jgi:hypothetical protein
MVGGISAAKRKREVEGDFEMLHEKRINDLIKAGRRVLASEFSEVAFGEWRKQALSCLMFLCGAEHAYTEYFRSKILKADRANVLTGVGVLTAAKMQHSQGTACSPDHESRYPVIESREAPSMASVIRSRQQQPHVS